MRTELFLDLTPREISEAIDRLCTQEGYCALCGQPGVWTIGEERICQACDRQTRREIFAIAQRDVAAKNEAIAAAQRAEAQLSRLERFIFTEVPGEPTGDNIVTSAIRTIRVNEERIAKAYAERDDALARAAALERKLADRRPVMVCGGCGAKLLERHKDDCPHVVSQEKLVAAHAEQRRLKERVDLLERRLKEARSGRRAATKKKGA
jgi:hypothetical protein